MAHILINGTKFSLDTAKEFQAALAAIPVTYKKGNWTVFDSDGAVTGETVDADFDPKAIALASELGVSPLTVDTCAHGDDLYESSEEPGEYRVLTDSERDTAWDESLESYIDECILPELCDKTICESTRTLAQYFDREAWKRDARHDGAGHSLASYDGNEREAKIDGQWYFIYRIG